MTRLATIPGAVQWSEGMFLSPQHFQQQQVYYDQLLRHLMEQARPWYWGIYDLGVDADKLQDGLVVVDRLHCVMPDGLVIEYDHAEETDGNRHRLSLDLTSHPEINDDRTVITVQVAVPVRGQAAASQESAAISRFDSEPETNVPDENTGSNLADLARLRPRLYLLPLEGRSSRYSSVPLFRLRRQHSGIFVLDKYEPPQLRTRVCEYAGRDSLGMRVSNALRRVRTKAEALRRAANAQLGGSIADIHATSIASLVSNLPGAEVLLSSGQAHPFDVYQALASLCGQLAQLKRGELPPELPPYKHEDLGPGFDQALAFIDAQLAEVNLRYETMAFDRDDAGVFRLELEEGWEQRPLVFELQSPPGIDDKLVKDWLLDCQVCTESVFSELQRQRQLGAEVKFIQSHARLDINTSQGSILCTVDPQPVYIKRGETLLLACTEESRSVGAPRSIIFYKPLEDELETS